MPSLDLHMSATGEHFRFHTSARRTGVFGFTWTLAPGKSGPSEHVHPHETESFRMVSGTLRVWLDGEPRDLRPGDELAIPAGRPHRFYNPGEEPAVVEVTLDGARLEDQFVPIAVMADGKRDTSLRDLFSVLPHLARAMAQGSVRPSSSMERSGFAALAWLAARFGHRPLAPVQRWDE
jgi:mannose-6-phosphate isomerase-like protein (cupin superfamily)